MEIRRNYEEYLSHTPFLNADTSQASEWKPFCMKHQCEGLFIYNVRKKINIISEKSSTVSRYVYTWKRSIAISRTGCLLMNREVIELPSFVIVILRVLIFSSNYNHHFIISRNFSPRFTNLQHLTSSIQF